MRLKVALRGETPVDRRRSPTSGRRPTGTSARCGTCSASASTGHPNLRRILMPPWWEGHPLRKEHPCRGTEMRPVSTCRPSRPWSGRRSSPSGPRTGASTSWPRDPEVMFLNVGPQHGGTHGVVHIVRRAARRGDRRLRAVDIGYHHRAAEKMARAPDLAHLHPLHRPHRLPRRRREQPAPTCLAGRAAGRHRGAGPGPGDPRHAQRALPHQQPPAVRTAPSPRTSARSRRSSTCSATASASTTSSRRSPAAACTPAGSASAAWPTTCRDGWEQLVARLPRLPAARACASTTSWCMESRIVRPRGRGVGRADHRRGDRVGRHRPEPARLRLRLGLPQEAALLGLRPVRVRHPDRPTSGDCYDRVAGAHGGDAPEPAHHRASASTTCPAGDYKARHPLATPPIKEPGTMHHIETLINHFLSVSWGPVIPPGEAFVGIEATKGNNGYYLISDGGTVVLPHAHPHAVLPASAGAAADGARAGGLRPDRHPRQHRLRHGGRGPMSARAAMLTRRRAHARSERAC